MIGETFGARGCVSSCSCDPCDCDPCGCGDSHHEGPNYPRWRVSGYHIVTGEIQGLDVSRLTLLSLAQPMTEGQNEQWQEVLLVDDRATREQIMALLMHYESQLESIPAEVEIHPDAQRAVYQVPLEYHKNDTELSLHVQFTPVVTACVRQGADHMMPRDWSYDGPMALRERVNEIQ